MKHLRLCLLALLALPLFAAQPYQGDCMLGGQTVSLNGLQSTNYVMQSYVNVSGGVPVSGCTVTVFVDGSGGMMASLYSDSALTMEITNPFTADANGHFVFYATNGTYDVQASNAGIATPFTRVISLFDPALYQPNDVFAYPSMGVPGIVGVYNGNSTYYGGFTVAAGITQNTLEQWPTIDQQGCMESNGATIMSFVPGCIPSGPNGAVQRTSFGSLLGDSNLVFLNQVLVIDGTSPTANALLITGNAETTGGFTSLLGSINSFTGATDGANLQGLLIGQNSTPNVGGYIHLTPLTYNPYNEPGTCKDQFGNVVQQPLPLAGDTFGSNDFIMWVGTSPLLPASPTANCPTPGGPPLPVQELIGLNVNGYILSLAGLATTDNAYNSIETFYGGFNAPNGGATLGTGVFFGPQASCASLPFLSGGFGGLAYQGANVYCAWNNSTTSWFSWTPGSGGGGGGSPGGILDSVQYNNPLGTFNGSSNFLFNPSTNVLTLGGGGYFAAIGGFDALTCSATNCVQAPDGGADFGLGVTAQAFYPSPSTGTPGLTPGAGFGGILYQGTGLNYWFYNQTGTTWTEVNLGASGSGCTISGGTAGNLVYLNTGGTTCTYSTNLKFLSQELGITTIDGQAGLTVDSPSHTGYIASAAGLVVLDSVAANSVQAVGNSAGCSSVNPCGGMSAAAFFAVDYIQAGAYSGTVSTGPPQTAGFPAFFEGAYSYNITSHCPTVFYDSGATSPGWNCVGGAGGAPGGPTSAIQINNSGGAFGGASNFVAPIVSSAVTQVTLANASFVTQGTSAGFDASQCTNDNCLQAPLGGALALEGIFGGNNGQYPSTIVLVGTAGSGSMGSQRSSITFVTCRTCGTATLWGVGVDLGGSGGSDFYIDSASGGLAISGNYATGNIGIGGAALTSTGQRLTVYGSSGVAGISLNTGFIQSPDYRATDTAANAIQITGSGGGFAANNPSGAAVSGCSYAIGTNCIVNTSLNAVVNNLTINGVCTGCSGGSAAEYIATNTGTSLTFTNNNGNFEVNGNGAVSIAGVLTSAAGIAINTCTVFNCFQSTGGLDVVTGGASTNGLTVDGLAVIGPTGQFVAAAGINTSGGGTFGSGVAMNNGFTTGSSTSSILYIGASGDLYMRYPGASSGISCSGIANGWFAITSDNYVVWCGNSGTRYRASGVSY